MRRAISAAGLGLLATTLAGCLHTPIPWSPDGSWIAYTVAVRPADPTEDVGYLFDPKRSVRLARTGPISAYRLWATRPASGTSVLLAESTGPITSPGWSPDGHALAFGRVTADGPAGHRFEVVVMDGLTRQRVVATEPIAALDAEVSRLPSQALVWSADGRFLAVPHLNPLGLAIIRADNGRTMQVIPEAFLPAWAPAGARLAFFVRGGDGATLQWIDSAQGAPRPLLDVGQASQAPAWTRDGSTLILVSRRPPFRTLDPRGGPELSQPVPMVDPVHLVRVRVETGVSEGLHTLYPVPGPRLRIGTVEGVSITADRELENVYYTLAIAGQNQVTGYNLANHEVVRKFPLVDPLLAAGSLALAPDGQTLAARLGSEQLSPPLWWETGSDVPRPKLVVPDDDARLDWIITLVRTARLLLADLPPVRVAGGPAEPLVRPTILPLVTDLNENTDLGPRLRRIAQLGRPLCDRPAEAAPLEPTARRILDEARVFFDYLREDYAEALRSLDALEPDASTPQRRLDLITVRAQVLLNKGRFREARHAVGLLEAASAHGQPGRPIEWTNEGYRFTDEGGAGPGWPHFLAESITRVQASLGGAADAPGGEESGAENLPNRFSPNQGLLFRRYPTLGPSRANLPRGVFLPPDLPR